MLSTRFKAPSFVHDHRNLNGLVEIPEAYIVSDEHASMVDGPVTCMAGTCTKTGIDTWKEVSPIRFEIMFLD